MSCRSIDRREFLGLLGAGSAMTGVGIGATRVIARTDSGAVVESDGEYGGFLVERLTSGQLPYECDPNRAATDE
jgi:hypothetical protein